METSTSFSIGDLTSVSLRCRCGAAITISLDAQREEGRRLADMVRRETKCPCGLVLWSNDDDDPARDLVRAIIKARRQHSAVQGVGLVITAGT